MGIESIDKVLLKVLKAELCSTKQILQMQRTCVRTQIKIQIVKGLLVSAAQSLNLQNKNECSSLENRNKER